MKFNINEEYSASSITNGTSYGIYDDVIALVDNQLEHLSDWIWSLQDDYMKDGESESDAYEYALEAAQYDISEAYPDAKNITIFKGIAPNGAFDVYIKYKCINKITLAGVK